ncbi:acyltransferase [[Ruminococcus] gnavus]|uniref:acyltransferase family protein n=1 Tax=Mediterraneibacter gnavus TaxID=33038 RepID=UPI00210D2B8A|nr:acyltransferase family protein [Mediterraneibacter gnavus]MCQ4701353.1 acyltransferase [Mediterraneibacter gnavus]
MSENRRYADTKCQKNGGGRDSNFELFRIVLMLLIVSHHYVVNSGISQLYDFNNITGNMILLQLFGFAGKIGINCFVFITGYFMIKSQFKFEKLLKLYLEIKFYRWILYIVFVISGFESFTIMGMIKSIFNIAYGVQLGFTGTFVFLYMLIPFVNAMLLNLNKKLHLILIGILVFLYTIISTFLFHDTYSNLGWMITTYIIAAYVRLYPCKWFENKKLYIWSTIFSVALSWASILVVDFVGSKVGFKNYYHMVANEHKFLALACSFSLFMLFRNIKIKQNKVINTIAASTFGVLLIHANSDAMRKFLWQDVLHNASYYNSPFLIVHAILSVILIYVVCVCIDQVRIHLLEKPLFSYIEKRKNK